MPVVMFPARMSTPSASIPGHAEGESGARSTGEWCDLRRRHFGPRSNAEGAVEERSEQVLGLAQRLPLHGTQALHSLNQGRELLL
jgi:hypothetical protein